MQRDRQIELLNGAKSRTDERVAAWIDDREVKAAIRFYHEQTREMKGYKTLKAACR